MDAVQTHAGGGAKPDDPSCFDQRDGVGKKGIGYEGESSNAIRFDEDGQIVDLDEPYPGGNLFSLASGGAIFLRDPRGVLTEDQLNGGEFATLEEEDWTLIEPYLKENARLFDIPVERLLQVDGHSRRANQIYRKIQPGKVRALQAEEAWVSH